MTSTFELICHHTYKGLAVDLSDYDSHAQAINTEFLDDGALPGSGAARFPLPQSRILVPASPASKSLGGIQVEVTLRRTRPLNDVSTLVAGHDSFSLSLVETELRAGFHGKRSPLIAGNTGLPTDSGGVRSARGSVVLGSKWMTLGFLHDGIDTMELYADGQLIARRTDLLASVSPVGPLGISIGNDPTGDGFCFLGGEIDEVKIWRLDPSIMDRQFFERPVDKVVADCWDRFFRSLAKALSRYPDCARRIDGALIAMIDGIRRTLMAKDPETRDRYIKACEQYLRLWRQGKLDSPEMAKLIEDWCAWLGIVGVAFKDDPALKDLLQSDCLKKVLAECAPLDCDPQTLALIRLVMKNCPQCVDDATQGELYGRRSDRSCAPV
ncbi:MAG: LamG-like jellyroll fold domain-containing protein [Desulfatitalea sp.]